VHYYAVDVRDDRAFEEFIDGSYAAFGRLDAVIHGAGVIEDKLIEDKAPASFARVFDTKVRSAFTLARKLRAETLKYLVFFSSVSARFGNRGQTDYAAANEVLNKLALQLDQQWPGRVVAIIWGPWTQIGLAEPAVQQQLIERGMHLIDPSAGRSAFHRELRLGRKGSVEVILGDGFWAAAHQRAPVADRAGGV
jgi:NAD(P)-dependent dehydrogenase (short-subunit alcohol dehydrogenase family)